jgi:acid phosphatase (class A)
MAAKAFHDVRTVSEQVATRSRRARPVSNDPGRPACERLTPAMRDSAAYPSLGAAAGAAYAEVLAALEPDHASAVRRIGRQIGVSRMVCAMNSPSDVAVGAALGRAVALQIITAPAFQAEAEAARRELEARRATGLTNPGCAAERAALAATAAD